MNSNRDIVMASVVNTSDGERESAITLGVLDAVSGNSALTQRHIASELGIALGLANAYLKRCIRKGLVKVSQAPANRYSYYLTPTGFAEKTRLTAEYLSQSLRFFRIVREQYGSIFDTCRANGHDRVVLWGVSDVAEIAALCADEHGIVVVGVLGDETAPAELYGLPVGRAWADFPDAQAVVIVDARVGLPLVETLMARLGADRVHAAPILGLRPAVSVPPAPMVVA